MSRVHVSLHRDDGTSERTPIAGMIRFAPSKRRTAGADVILPAGFDAELVGGEVTVELAPTGPDWCWMVIEPTKRGLIRYIIVPDDVPAHAGVSPRQRQRHRRQYGRPRARGGEPRH